MNRLKDDAELHCFNCKAVLLTKFCGACGQKSGMAPRSVRSAFSDILGNVFSYDNKLWRSLAKLSFQPGSLTKAYREGRRSSYFDPLRMFLFFMAIVFFAPDTISIGEYQLPEEWSVPAQADVSFIDRLRVGSERAVVLRDSDREGFVEFLNQATVQFLILDFMVGIACLSLFLRLFMRESYFAEHFVFALHFSCLIMFTNLILRLVIPDVGFTGIEFVVMSLIEVIYFPWAFMVVYGGAGWKRRTKTILFSVVAFFVYLVPYTMTAQLSSYYLLMPPAG